MVVILYLFHFVQEALTICFTLFYSCIQQKFYLAFPVAFLGTWDSMMAIPTFMEFKVCWRRTLLVRRPCKKCKVITARMTPEVQVTARLCEGTFKEDVLEEVLFDLRSERYTKMTRGSDR